jgi:hypothetical protein
MFFPIVIIDVGITIKQGHSFFRMESNNNANQQGDNYSKEIAETVSDSSDEEEHVQQKQQQEPQCTLQFFITCIPLSLQLT